MCKNLLLYGVIRLKKIFKRTKSLKTNKKIMKMKKTLIMSSFTGFSISFTLLILNSVIGVAGTLMMYIFIGIALTGITAISMSILDMGNSSKKQNKTVQSKSKTKKRTAVVSEQRRKIS